MLHDNLALLRCSFRRQLTVGLVGLFSLALMGCNLPATQTTPCLDLSSNTRAVDSLQRMEAALSASERPVFEAALHSLITAMTQHDISVWTHSITKGTSSTHTLSFVQLNRMTTHDIIEAAQRQQH